MSELGSDKSQWIRSALDQYEAQLMRYAAKITGSVESARDVVQETFLKLCLQEPSSLDGRLPQWLYTVCRNHAIDTKRRTHRMKLVTTTDISQNVADGPSPADAAEVADEHRTILSAMQSLPDRQQEIIRLRFQGGLSYQQIAEVLDITSSNVGFLIHTAIKSIRQTVQPQAVRSKS